MNLPTSIIEALSSLPQGLRQEDMIRDAQSLSHAYRSQNASGMRLVTVQAQAVAYAAARMPATFCAVTTALQHALDCTRASIRTVIDAGAGTGAASWAASTLLALDNILCLEREPAMRSVGQVLMQSGNEVLKNAAWQGCDLATDTVTDSADLVIMGYVLNEMARDSRVTVLKKLWNAASHMLLIVEPGTPAGYANLMDARTCLLGMGAHMAAPCPHEKQCPMTDNDWCHFSCRVQRTKLHKQLKGGEAGYEDEKFSYMAFVRDAANPVQARILRHPQVHKGHVTLTLCCEDGIRKQTISKKDGEMYKLSRDAAAGGSI